MREKTDKKHLEEGFVYLKNTGNLKFKPYALSPDTRFERAVIMDEGDLNADSKPDLLIGNAFFDFGPFGYSVKEPLFFILKNQKKLIRFKFYESRKLLAFYIIVLLLAL